MIRLRKQGTTDEGEWVLDDDYSSKMRANECRQE